ncbi:MAG: metallophosphoesterase family protein [Pseudomonadota bacterium]
MPDCATVVPNAPLTRIYYAIGDVHGEAARLSKLHETIFEHHLAFHPDTCATLVHLGDYVDRGPDSRGVIERLRALEKAAANNPALEVICLRGNHEQMMIEALDGGAMAEALWARNGGVATLDSYEACPAPGLLYRHHAWLKSRPFLHWSEEDRLVFVHAGLSGDLFPDEKPETYLWTRSDHFFDTANWSSSALEGHRVVHGHTPTDDYKPFVTDDGRRINIDTGACWGGQLTAAIIAPGDTVRFLSV